MKRTSIAAGIACLGTLLATGADAQVSHVQPIQNATGFCQGATWTDDRHLIKEALDMLNYSKKPAHIVCSLATNIGGQDITQATLLLVNYSDHAASITCTLVPAFAEFNLGFRTISKTVMISPEGGNGSINWYSSENIEGNSFAALNFTCVLPQYTGVVAGSFKATES